MGLPKITFLHKWRPLQKLITRHLATRSIYAHHPIKRTGTGKNNQAFYFYSIHVEPAQLRMGGDYKQGSWRQGGTTRASNTAHSLDKLVKEVSDFSHLF